MISNAYPLLLIDRETTGRHQLAQQLEQFGCQVALAQPGPQALALLREHVPTLIVLALSEPATDALDLLQQIKQDETLRHIPIIATTTTAMVEQVAQAEQAIAAGADDYLLQPVSSALLHARLRRWLGPRQAESASLQDNAEQSCQQSYERELQIGRQIQAGFLPEALPQPDGWEIAARFQPARQVAGDFYDAFTLTQNRRVGFVIGDVCDKGVGAALFMALFRSLIRAFAQQHHSMSWADVLSDRLSDSPASPSKQRLKTQQQSFKMIGANALRNAVVMTNNYMVENHRKARMYATLFFGVLDPSTGSLIYVNGGHNPPLLLDASGSIRAQLEPTGPVVGIFPGADVGIQQVQFEPGDTLFCYTDGLMDARNAAGEFFSEERMLHLATQPAPSAASLLEHIETSVRAHIADAPQFDDLTMLAVRRMTEQSA